MGLLRVTIILALAALTAAFGIPGWLASPDSPYLARAAAYSFFHASWWHLAVNSLAIWTIFRKPNPRKACAELALAYVVAVIVYPLSLRPVIGFSNILYAVIGYRTPPLSSPWWGRTEVIVFLAVTVGMLLIPRFSATTHIAAFAMGIGAAYLRRLISPVINDARRYL
ncbi:MAG: rhomboid family intramembrane serine protease [Bacteroidales bacterium]|nr:rhomboid family intramembrane serine protease [Bacteroidales bacterium]